MSQSPSRSESKGKLYVVGTGPGDVGLLTPQARQAIRIADVVLGHKLYLDLVRDELEGKEVISSGMGREVERAREALRLAKERTVTLVSGGDAGVYGMASIVLELAEREEPGIEVEVVPGITAASAAAARLGAPLSGDFVVISLSDLLTPWEEVERRLDLAFEMKVPVAMYNPRSRGRSGNLAKALAIALKHLSPQTPVGVVRNAYRPQECVFITTLGQLCEDDGMVDMHCTVIIGGENSRIWKEGNHVKGIITPRGYHRKYVY
ncbi:MAG: precorrin-3B C(17)-methyltransferase [Methanomassiliicoccales archaeon]